MYWLPCSSHAHSPFSIWRFEKWNQTLAARVYLFRSWTKATHVVSYLSLFQSYSLNWDSNLTLHTISSHPINRKMSVSYVYNCYVVWNEYHVVLHEMPNQSYQCIDKMFTPIFDFLKSGHFFKHVIFPEKFIKSLLFWN